MKKVLTLVVALAVLLGVFGAVEAASAADARTASWAVSITYQNVGAGDAHVMMHFYEEGSAVPVEYDAGMLKAGAGASLYIGKVSVDDGFRGSAVLSSGEPLVATVVQFSNDAGFKMRLLSNGFQAAQASDNVLIASTFGNTFNRTTVFSIQNTEGEEATATVEFFGTDGLSKGSVDYDIPAYSTKYIEMDNTTDTGLPSATFNGSAVVTGVLKSDGITPAGLVAGVSELYTDRAVAANFEGLPVAAAANTIYMATGVCDKFGLDTFYAVQNASSSQDATITVQYYNLDGTPAGSETFDPIGPGVKQSIRTCNATVAGFTGSAVIESVGGEIVAVGKAQASASAKADTKNVFAIFMGENAGATKMALPFVRWANDANYTAKDNVGGKQRAYIAVQNLSGADAKFNAFYYDKNGDLVATHVLDIPADAKQNTNASLAGALGQNGMVAGEFGYYTDGTFGGAVIIEAHADNPTATFIAIARVQHPGAGEDYNAVAVP